MGTFTKFARKVSKAERKKKRKFGKGIGKHLKKRKTAKRSIYDLY